MWKRFMQYSNLFCLRDEHSLLRPYYIQYNLSYCRQLTKLVHSSAVIVPQYHSAPPMEYAIARSLGLTFRPCRVPGTDERSAWYSVSLFPVEVRNLTSERLRFSSWSRVALRLTSALSPDSILSWFALISVQPLRSLISCVSAT